MWKDRFMVKRIRYDTIRQHTRTMIIYKPYTLYLSTTPSIHLYVLAMAALALVLNSNSNSKSPTKTVAFTQRVVSYYHPDHTKHSSGAPSTPFGSSATATTTTTTTTTPLWMATTNYDDFHDEGENDDHDHDNKDDENNNNDADFYRDLQQAKQQQKPGGSKASPEGENNNDDDDDDAFYRDLQRAKQEKLGGSIPPEQAKESAAEAEADFLRAMRETKDEFQKAKEELGSDGAVDLFLDRIREEDKTRGEEEALEDNNE